VFAPPSDAVRADVLLEREELLIEQLAFVSGASYRRREEIELELGSTFSFTCESQVA
jgi:hypothetical protein